MKKLISTLCLVAMLITAFASCANDQPEETTEALVDSTHSSKVSSDDTGKTTTDSPESTTETTVSPTTDSTTTNTPNPPILENKEVITVHFTSPAIKADNGKTYDLSLFNVEFSKGKETEASKITWKSDDIEIKDGKYVTPQKNGVYVLTATAGSTKKNIYLVSKNSNETEYVLYYNDFSDAKITDFKIVQNTSASAEIKNGTLVLNASASTSAYLRLLFPDFLADFGDYKITTKAAVNNAKNNRRWASVMFRVQSKNYPYYQMAFRRNASGDSGIELAERTSANKWLVRHNGSFTEDMKSGTFYTFTADVYAGYASMYVNGKKYIEGSDFGEYAVGHVGVQANGCTAIYDEIKIVLSENETDIPMPGITNVSKVTTGIINSAAIITKLDTASLLDSASTLKITAGIITLNKNLEAVDKNGNVIASIKDVFAKLKGKVIPAFEVPDVETAEKLAAFLQKNVVTDVMLISDNKEILTSVHKIYPVINGIYDARAIKLNVTSYKSQLYEIRTETNKANCRIVLLSEEFADKEYVEYLQRRATTVWFATESTGITEHVRLITSGAHGILTASPSTLVNAMGSKYFVANSMIRQVQVIGHRGMPSKGPENTIESSILAMNYGATIIENDVYLTKDGVVVVMHDSTIDRTTNGTGKVESFTYAELSKYYVDCFEGQQAKIPTLEDYFKEFKGKDVFFFIEIKTTNKNVIPPIRQLMLKYDIMDQCGIIAFKEDMADYARSVIPEISCGYLSSSIKTVEAALVGSQLHDCTFNPSKAVLTPEIVRTLTLRGVTVWPWTLNNSSEFDTYYLAGAAGLTTNFSDFASEYLKSLDTDKKSYSFSSGASADVILTSTNYKREEATVTGAEMILVSGNGTLKYENGKLTASASGDADIMFRVSYKLNNGKTVYVYTQPVSVSVK